MTTELRGLLGAVVLSLLSIGSAEATTIHVTFSGTVREILNSIGDPASPEALALLARHGIAPGAALAGGYAADTSVEDDAPINPTRGLYLDSTIDAFLDVGSLHAIFLPDSGIGEAFVRNDSGAPFHDILSVTMPLQGDLAGVALSLGWVQLRDSSEVALASDAYPATLAALSEWDGFVSGDSTGTGAFLGVSIRDEVLIVAAELSSFQVAPVPLPAAWWMLGGGLGAALGVDRRRRGVRS